MADQPVLRNFRGVFELVRIVPEFGGLVGDRMVVGQRDSGAIKVALVREVPDEAAEWALRRDVAVYLNHWEPNVPEGVARRHLREMFGLSEEVEAEVATDGGLHLTLLH